MDLDFTGVSPWCRSQDVTSNRTVELAGGVTFSDQRIGGGTAVAPDLLLVLNYRSAAYLLLGTGSEPVGGPVVSGL